MTPAQRRPSDPSLQPGPPQPPLHFWEPCLPASTWTSPCHASSISARASPPPAQTGNLRVSFYCSPSSHPNTGTVAAAYAFTSLASPAPFPTLFPSSGGEAPGEAAAAFTQVTTPDLWLRGAGAGVTEPRELSQEEADKSRG